MGRTRGDGARRAVVRHLDECETESWSSPERGSVTWWELVGGDRTATDEMTVGVAEIPCGSTPPPRGHRHDATEVYVIVSGFGEVHVDGNVHEVRPGTAVWIPEGAEHFAHNTGDEPLRLIYVFARDRFSDVHYEFPGQ